MFSRRVASDYVRTVALSLLLFLWLTGFFWQILGLDLLVRVVESFLLIFILSVLSRSSFKIPRVSLFLACLLGFLLFILISFAHDRGADYIETLYLKTLGYLLLSIFLGLSVCRYLGHDATRRTAFLRSLGASSVLLIGFVFALALKESWRPGAVLLGTYLGDAYQGVSRVVGLCILLAVALRQSLPALSWLLGAIGGLLLLFSLNSFGAFFSVILAAGLILRKATSDSRSIALFFFTFLAGAAFLALNAGLLESVSNEGFWVRLQGKFDGSASDEQSRLMLMVAGLELWIKDFVSFMIGVGPMNYACNVGFCDGYRHPHNLFVNFLIWFGVFGIPIILFVLYLSLIALKYYLFSSHVLESLLGALFLNFFLLSMIGGDIEQNRHLIFIASLLFFFRCNRLDVPPRIILGDSGVSVSGTVSKE